MKTTKLFTFKSLLLGTSSKFLLTIIALIGLSITVSAVVPARDVFVWNGSTSNNWATAANWTKTTGTISSANTYPGETAATDSVVISNGGTPNLASGSATIYRLMITNTTGATSGSTLTISSGATLVVSGAIGTTQGSPAIIIKGGNIVNNGTLTVTTTATAACYLIYFVSPVVAPSSPTIYGYSGTGTLNLNNNVSGAVSYGFWNASTNANTTYKLSFDGTFNFTGITGSYACGVAASSTSPLLISGVGFTLGSVGSPVTLGLISQVGGGTSVTVDAGTTLTSWSASGNTAKGIFVNCSTSAPNATFTNKGTINGYGTSNAAFISLANTYIATANTLTFDNQGTINTDIAVNGTYLGVLNIPNGGSGNAAALNITNSGSMTIKNTSVTANAGYAIYVGNTTPVTATINNTGTFDLNGVITSTGAQVTTLNNNNNGIVNIRTSSLDKTIFNNNSGATLNCISANVVSNSAGTPSYVATLAAGSTLKTAIAGGVACLSGTGAVLNAAANYEFNGSVAQTTGSALTTANNVTINNAAGVTLSAATTVNGVLTMTSGTLTLGARDLTIGAAGSITPSQVDILANSTGVLIQLATATENVELSKIAVLVNKNQVTVKGLVASDVVSIYNTSGQKIKQIGNTNEQTELVLSNGIYILKVATATGTKVAKVIIR